MNKGPHSSPPEWANRFLVWFCSSDQLEILQGDLLEIFEGRVEKVGLKKARFMFVFDVLDMLRPFALKRKNNAHNTNPMIKNYIKVSYRNFLRQKVYSLINLSGLAIGMACSILIYLYVHDELSYDTFHSKAERIYRIPENYQSDGVGEHSASNPFALGPTIVAEYPHLIEQMVRFFNFQAPSMSLVNKENERGFNEPRLFFVDSTLFEVMDFKLIVGDKKTALDEPNSILLTESMTARYFGEENPLGKTLEFQGSETLVVRGIMEDAPLNAHFQFDALISFSTVRSMLPASWLTRFYWNPCWTYLLLRDNNLKAELEAQLPNYVKKYYPERKSDFVTLELQPLLDIHLTSRLDYEIRANGSESNIYVFSTIALFVLLIASINFINLSTARATKRAKEVGIRKTLGSRKSQLIGQFIFEAILYTLIATFISLIIVYLSVPYFNGFTEKEISLNVLLTYDIIGLFIGLVLTVGLLSGIYPSFVLSSFEPVKVLKGGQLRISGYLFRKALVTTQFVVSLLLIVGTIIAVRQLNLLQDNNLGFDREQVVMVPVVQTPIGESFETMRQEMQRHPDIISVTAVEEIVGSKNQVGIYHFEGMDGGRPFPRLTIRHDFLRTFGIELSEGRDYSEQIASDEDLALIVNEAMVKSLGWGSNEAALGKTFKRGEGQGKIIGVVKDFNYASKHLPIAPLLMDLDLRPGAFKLFLKYMAVRISGSNIPEALVKIEETWKTFIPERPFEYFFLDERLAQSYKDEQKLSQLTAIFSGLAILVACLGLFGLATFTIEQKTKEIGIRKVLGMNAPQTVYLLSRDFMLLIAIALLIASPLTMYLLDVWLNEFAYRVTIGIVPFLAGGAVVVLTAFLVIGLQGLKATYVNPATILKDE